MAGRLAIFGQRMQGSRMACNYDRIWRGYIWLVKPYVQRYAFFLGWNSYDLSRESGHGKYMTDAMCVGGREGGFVNLGC